MKEYYALIDEKGQIGAVACAKRNSCVNMSAREYFREQFPDAREYFREKVTRGQAVCITRREAGIYARLLREKKGIEKRLSKIEVELGVK